MTAKEKCISKWERKLKKTEEQQLKCGNSFYNNYREKIEIYKEVLKDLKRVV